MAMVFVNDIGANPWIIAEAGLVTDKQIKVRSFTYCEPDSPAHVVDFSDADGRPLFRLSDDKRNVDFAGWVHGLTVDQLDSGYVVVSLMSGGD